MYSFDELNIENIFPFLKIQIQNQELVFNLQGISMLPLITEGNKVILQKLFKAPKRFDILIFLQGNKLICHYFWGKNNFFTDAEKQIYITRPLNPMRSYDNPIYSDQILGIVKNYRLSRWLKFKIYLNFFYQKWSNE